MVVIVIAFLVAYILCKGEFRRKGLSEDLLDLFLVANVLGGIIGAFLFIEQAIGNIRLTDIKLLFVRD